MGHDIIITRVYILHVHTYIYIYILPLWIGYFYIQILNTCGLYLNSILVELVDGYRIKNCGLCYYIYPCKYIVLVY